MSRSVSRAPRRRSKTTRTRQLASRTLALALAALAVCGLAACGDSHTRVSTGTYAGASGKNAPYLNVGPLIYEVQLSRELNPYNTEDASYLAGVPAAERQLQPGEEWFGVFMQVYNNTHEPHPIATGLTIADTQGNVYHPIIPANPYAYQAGNVPPKNQIPAPNTIAASGPTQGALLLYKIKVISLDNRPLTLKISDPLEPHQSASAELDV